MSERRRGMLVRWLADRDYGFIEPAGGGPDVFVTGAAFRFACFSHPRVGLSMT